MNEAPATLKLLLTSKALAAALSISERTLATLKKEGEIPFVLVGKRNVRFDPEEVKGYLERQTRTGPT